MRQRIAHANDDADGRRNVLLELEQVRLDRCDRQNAGVLPQLVEQRSAKVDGRDLEPALRERDGLRAMTRAEVDGPRSGARVEAEPVEERGASRLERGEIAGHPRVDGPEMLVVMLLRACHRRSS